MAYITEQELENYLKRDLTEKESDNFSIIEAAAASIIDTFCGTTFEEAGEATTRYFDGGEQEIQIDPCSDLSYLGIVDNDFSDSTEYEDEDYIAEPYNKDIKLSLRLRGGRFPSGIKNIKVTAKFSSYIDEIPPEVKLATFKLCSDILNGVDFKSESIEGYSYTMAERLEKDEELKQTLVKFRRVYL